LQTGANQLLDEKFAPLPTYPLVLSQKGTSNDVVTYAQTVSACIFFT